MQVTAPLRRAAQVNPTGTATIFKDREHNWLELLERVQKLAGALQKLGMKPGDRVALLSLNSDRFVEYRCGPLLYRVLYDRVSVWYRQISQDPPVGAMVEFPGPGKCFQHAGQSLLWSFRLPENVG